MVEEKQVIVASPVKASLKPQVKHVDLPPASKIVGLPKASGLGYELIMRGIRVLHLTQLNDNSPTRERIEQAGLDRGIKVDVLEVKPTPSYEFNFDLIDLNGIDSILCTAYFDIDQEREGNFL